MDMQVIKDIAIEARRLGGARMQAIEMVRKELGCDIIEAQRIIDQGRALSEEEFFWYLAVQYCPNQGELFGYTQAMVGLWTDRQRKVSAMI